jgi:hypothetical protein
MAESNQTPNNADQSNSGQNNGRPYGDMYWVYIIGSWSLIGLLLVAIFWPGMTERLRFFVTTLWVLVTAFAVIAQAVIYRKQWAIMESSLSRSDTAIELTKQSISFNEKSFEYAQRAYVVAKIRDIGDRDETLQFRLRIENSGNTPANDVTVFYSCGLREKSPHEKDPETGLIVYDIGYTETERLGLIAPNGSYHVISTPEISAVQADPAYSLTEEFKRFEAGEFRFYCWGRIVYEDIFNEKRQTEFCFFQSIEQPNGYPCQYGNHAM